MNEIKTYMMAPLEGLVPAREAYRHWVEGLGAAAAQTYAGTPLTWDAVEAGDVLALAHESWQATSRAEGVFGDPEIVAALEHDYGFGYEPGEEFRQSWQRGFLNTYAGGEFAGTIFKGR